MFDIGGANASNRMIRDVFQPPTNARPVLALSSEILGGGGGGEVLAPSSEILGGYSLPSSPYSAALAQKDQT